MQKFENRKDITLADDVPVRVSVLQEPKHGKLEVLAEGYLYDPHAGYFGKDRAVIQVEIGDYRVKVIYFLQAVNRDFGSDWEKELCGKKGHQWKISLLDTPMDPSAIQSLLSFTGIDTPVKIEISDLAGGAVGSTQGTTITLDTHAAGYNWFIDYTPYLNEEYLPTALRV